MSFVGAIDQGTTSTRFILFDHAGAIVSSGQQEFQQYLPDEGRTEHDPEEIWNTVEYCVAQALSSTNPKNTLQRAIDVKEIACVGITNQRETSVVWDRATGKPYYRALVWMDMRSEDICGELTRNHKEGQERFRTKTGLPVSPYFSGTKIMWLLANVPELRDAAVRGDALFGTIDSWLLWKLSGGKVHATDVTNASRTLLMNINTLEWDEDQCHTLGIPRAMLPEIRSSSEIYCHGAIGTCLEGVPISGILGDQQAALFGQAGMNPGAVKNTYGTGCFTLCNVGAQVVQSHHGLLSTVAFKLGPKQNNRVCYALEGSVPFAGACVEWLVKRLELIKKASESEQLSDAHDNGGVYFVPAFSGLYAPYWRDDARGVIVGLTRYANKGHLIRSALEAVCFQTREVCDAMRLDAEMSGVNLGNLSVLKVDGGMTVNERLMQMQADILHCEVQRPKIVETTALGAAYVAGLATGFFASEAEVAKQWKLDRTFNPDERAYSSERRSREFGRWKRAIQRTLHWMDDEDPTDMLSNEQSQQDKREEHIVGVLGLLSLGLLAGISTGLAIGFSMWGTKKSR
jgi:glycerol kinase